MQKKSLPIISIVIPTYNHGKHLFNTISSVLTQKSIGINFDIEIIVVDDASTDDTKEIVKNIIKENKKFDIKYVRHAKNLGIDAPVNTGLLKAKGDYLCTLDADDSFTKDSLKLRLDAISNNEFNYVVGSIIRNDKNGKRKIIKNTDISKIDSIINFLKMHPKDEGLNNCTILFKRKIFKEIGLRNEKRKNGSTNNDYEFFLRLLTKFKGLNISKPLYTYNYYDNSNLNTEGVTDIQSKNRKLLEKKYIQIFKKLLNKIPNK